MNLSVLDAGCTFTLCFKACWSWLWMSGLQCLAGLLAFLSFLYPLGSAIHSIAIHCCHIVLPRGMDRLAEIRLLCHVRSSGVRKTKEFLFWVKELLSLGNSVRDLWRNKALDTSHDNVYRWRGGVFFELEIRPHQYELTADFSFSFSIGKSYYICTN